MARSGARRKPKPKPRTKLQTRGVSTRPATRPEYRAVEAEMFFPKLRRDAKDKIEKGDLNAYKELSEAYLADGELDKAIAAGERYVKANPKDYEFMRSLASDYEGKA